MVEGVKAPSPLEDIMRKVLLSKNPHTGKETWIEDTVDGLQVNTKVDVSPVLDLAKKQEVEYCRHTSTFILWIAKEVWSFQAQQKEVAEMAAKPWEQTL